MPIPFEEMEEIEAEAVEAAFPDWLLYVDETPGNVIKFNCFASDAGDVEVEDGGSGPPCIATPPD